MAQDVDAMVIIAALHSPRRLVTQVVPSLQEEAIDLTDDIIPALRDAGDVTWSLMALVELVSCPLQSCLMQPPQSAFDILYDPSGGGLSARCSRYNCVLVPWRW